VLIHDGARPWIDADLVFAVLEAARETGACVPCLEASEAIKEIDEGRYIVHHLARSRLRCAQTPQGFRFQEILSAHEQAWGEAVSCSDDAELYDRYVGRVSWIPGVPENRKITWPHDVGGI
jgi:2-C-methyl-D-erythritol 4-phosphate cytidylyltransferase